MFEITETQPAIFFAYVFGASLAERYGSPPGVAPGLAVAVLLTSERSVIVSTALLCGWLPHAGDSDDRTDEGRTII